MPWSAQERPRTAARPLGIHKPRSPESRLFQALHGRRATRLAPEVSSSSRRKRAGFAAHGEIIADGPQNGKGRSRANGPLKRAEINAGPVKSSFSSPPSPRSARAGALQGVISAV